MARFSSTPRVAAIVIICASLFSYIKGQIPGPCGTEEVLNSKMCCPAPMKFAGASAGPCGANLMPPRGICANISDIVPGLQLSDSPLDNRMNWPHYFNKLCKCNGNFAGYDCGQCKFGYRGDQCDEMYMRRRQSITSLSRTDRDKYIDAIIKAKNDSYSRYMAITNNDPLRTVSVPLYDLFTWIHFFVGRENARISNPMMFPNARDYAHEAGGFLTWHRLYLLWFEQEMQILTQDDEFSIPYWDWSKKENREVLFDDSWFGSRKANGEIGGGSFGTNWMTVCWFGKTTSLINNNVTDVCNPSISTGPLRRCPVTDGCNKGANTWPDENEVHRALGFDTYDNEPFSRISNSFRNFLEGFDPNDCEDNMTLCIGGIRRRLHNSIHLILGIGDFGKLDDNKMVGTMADVAGAANDPLFISHHAMIDNIFEQWLQKNTGVDYAPTSQLAMDNKKKGHGANDVLVPFIPLYTNMEFFEEAETFGYEYDGAKPGLSIGVSVVTMMVVITLVV